MPTILHCRAIGNSRFLANGSFWVVKYPTGSVNERRVRATKGAASGPVAPRLHALSQGVRQPPDTVRQESGAAEAIASDHTISDLLIR